jgi:hypothetical protein
MKADAQAFHSSNHALYLHIRVEPQSWTQMALKVVVAF